MVTLAKLTMLLVSRNKSTLAWTKENWFFLSSF
jgi:hypothetical protein